MNDDATSLDRLHDIIEPAAAWWPLAPGIQVVLSLAALLLVIGLLRAFIAWQHNRYRREALAELHALTSKQQVGDDKFLVAISALLKRTALTAFPREQVAALTGPQWFAFLDRTGRTNFSGGLGTALENANYHVNQDAFDSAQRQALIVAVRHWIKHHKVTVSDADMGVMAEMNGT